MTLSPYRKAAVAFAVAFTGSLAVGAADDWITLGELVVAVGAGVAAAGAVFKVRNDG